MPLNDILTAALEQLPDGLALGYVDMATGLLEAVATNKSYPEALFDELARHTSALLQGAHITHAEDVVDRARGTQRDEGEHYFNDMILFSDHTLHVFLRGRENPDHVLVCVCRETASMGMVLLHARSARKRIDADYVAERTVLVAGPATLPVE